MARANPRDEDFEEDEPGEEPVEIDLHGLMPEAAFRKLGQELHACRVRHVRVARVITGRGWGNLEQKPVLRPRVEEWLRGDEGKRHGVQDFDVTSRGGALLVRLVTGGARA